MENDNDFSWNPVGVNSSISKLDEELQEFEEYCINNPLLTPQTPSPGNTSTTLSAPSEIPSLDLWTNELCLDPALYPPIESQLVDLSSDHDIAVGGNPLHELSFINIPQEHVNKQEMSQCPEDLSACDGDTQMGSPPDDFTWMFGVGDVADDTLNELTQYFGQTSSYDNSYDPEIPMDNWEIEMDKLLCWNDKDDYAKQGELQRGLPGLESESSFHDTATMGNDKKRTHKTPVLILDTNQKPQQEFHATSFRKIPSTVLGNSTTQSLVNAIRRSETGFIYKKGFWVIRDPKDTDNTELTSRVMDDWSDLSQWGERFLHQNTMTEIAKIQKRKSSFMQPKTKCHGNIQHTILVINTNLKPPKEYHAQSASSITKKVPELGYKTQHGLTGVLKTVESHGKKGMNINGYLVFRIPPTSLTVSEIQNMNKWTSISNHSSRLLGDPDSVIPWRRGQKGEIPERPVPQRVSRNLVKGLQWRRPISLEGSEEETSVEVYRNQGTMLKALGISRSVYKLQSSKGENINSKGYICTIKPFTQADGSDIAVEGEIWSKSSDGFYTKIGVIPKSKLHAFHDL